jgi:hypothetical protein
MQTNVSKPLKVLLLAKDIQSFVPCGNELSGVMAQTRKNEEALFSYLGSRKDRKLNIGKRKRKE